MVKKGTGSRRTQGDVIKLPQHRHCVECGKAMPVESGDCCSDACQNTFDARVQKKKLWIYLQYGSIAAGTVLLLLLFSGVIHI